MPPGLTCAGPDLTQVLAGRRRIGPMAQTLGHIDQATITLRAPTVKDIRSAGQTSDGDDAQREMNLFASLADVGVKDLEGLTYKDYNRVATGYNFLVQDDEL